MFDWRGGKVGGWKTFLFGWKEKGDDGKCNLYKLTIMSLLYNSGKVKGVGEYNKVGVFVYNVFLITLLSSFSSQFGRIKKVSSGGKTFSPIFCLSYFLSLTKQ